MVIYLRPYASVIRCIYENNKMAGEFIILDKVNYSIPFEASYGQAYRFLKIQKKATCRSTVHGMRFLLKILLISLMQSEVSAKWTKKSRVLLEQKLVIFRYLSWRNRGDKPAVTFHLWCHAFLFKADISDSLMTGVYYSGLALSMLLGSQKIGS
ncbi:MAG: hypothetical protein U0T81_04260 [Saprospiraceae bacterium]